MLTMSLSIIAPSRSGRTKPYRCQVTEQDLVALGVSDAGYGSLPPAAREPSFDSDGDGMADAWEQANRLDPQDPADGNLDVNGDGYTNLEGYLAALTL